MVSIQIDHVDALDSESSVDSDNLVDSDNPIDSDNPVDSDDANPMYENDPVYDDFVKESDDISKKEVNKVIKFEKIYTVRTPSYVTRSWLQTALE